MVPRRARVLPYFLRAVNRPDNSNLHTDININFISPILTTYRRTCHTKPPRPCSSLRYPPLLPSLRLSACIHQPNLPTLSPPSSSLSMPTIPSIYIINAGSLATPLALNQLKADVASYKIHAL